jgi:hypothetical protein
MVNYGWNIIHVKQNLVTYCLSDGKVARAYK